MKFVIILLIAMAATAGITYTATQFYMIGAYHKAYAIAFEEFTGVSWDDFMGAKRYCEEVTGETCVVRGGFFPGSLFEEIPEVPDVQLQIEKRPKGISL